MAFDVNVALLLVKQRKDMLTGINQRDDYMMMRIKAVVSELERTGIHLTDSIDDLLLVVDMAVWQYNNRDQSGAEPEWLRQRRRERWLADRSRNPKEGCFDDP